jgi:hypothetical protein
METTGLSCTLLNSLLVFAKAPIPYGTNPLTTTIATSAAQATRRLVFKDIDACLFDSDGLFWFVPLLTIGVVITFPLFLNF